VRGGGQVKGGITPGEGPLFFHQIGVEVGEDTEKRGKKKKAIAIGGVSRERPERKPVQIVRGPPQGGNMNERAQEKNSSDIWVGNEPLNSGRNQVAFFG